MTTVIGFCGFAQSGKDTAAQFLIEHGFRRLAFADALRDSLYALNPIVEGDTFGEDVEYDRVKSIVDRIGWDRAKVVYPEIRQLLQRFGTEVGRSLYGENFWVDRVMDKIVTSGRYVITDVRFPNEERAVHDAGGQVFRIMRPGIGAVNAHASENVDDLSVDGVILNDGDLEAFRSGVLLAIGLK